EIPIRGVLALSYRETQTIAHVVLIALRDLALKPQEVPGVHLLLGKILGVDLTGLDGDSAVTDRGVQLVLHVQADGPASRLGSRLVEEDNLAVRDGFSLVGDHSRHRGGGEFRLATRQQDRSQQGQGNKGTHRSTRSAPRPRGPRPSWAAGSGG